MPVIKSFNCLNGQSVINAKLSDHEPIVSGEYCTFNILTKCWHSPGVGKHPSNNAFNINENSADYMVRIEQLLKVIQELRDDHGVKVFAFQEAPNKSLPVQAAAAAYFYQELNNLGFLVCVKPTEKTSSYLANAVLEKDYKISEIEQYFNDPVTKGKTLGLKLIPKDASKKVQSMINFHGDYNTQAATIGHIKTAVHNGAICLGDFNFDQQTFNSVAFGNALKPSLAAHHCLEKAKLFSTMDGIFRGDKSKTLHFVFGADKDPSIDLPVHAATVTQRITNPDLYNFTFINNSAAQDFSKKLFYATDKACCSPSSKTPLEPKDHGIGHGMTVVVHKDFLNAAKTCCKVSNLSLHASGAAGAAETAALVQPTKPDLKSASPKTLTKDESPKEGSLKPLALRVALAIAFAAVALYLSSVIGGLVGALPFVIAATTGLFIWMLTDKTKTEATAQAQTKEIDISDALSKEGHFSSQFFIPSSLKSSADMSATTPLQSLSSFSPHP